MYRFVLKKCIRVIETKISLLSYWSLQSSRHPIMLCQLLCCFVRENSMVSAKCFWKDIWKTSSDSISGLIAGTLGESKKGAVALECCQKWRKTRHLGFSHHHFRELSVWKKWERHPPLLSFFNRLSHVLTMHAFFFHTRCLWIIGYWHSYRTHGHMTFCMSFTSLKHQLKAQWVGRTCLRLQTWCFG